MIKTATQLKAKIRNLSGGDNDRARVLIRNFVMERFLERVALSQYRNNFILKGGMLVAAAVGLETRTTAFGIQGIRSFKCVERTTVHGEAAMCCGAHYLSE